MTQDPNLSKIELIASALGPLRDRLYSDRGGSDMLASHDLEDIINVVDGRPGLLEEIRNAPVDLRAYLIARFAGLLMTPNFLDVLPALIFPDESLAERTQVVTERIRLLVQQGTDRS